MTKNLIVNGLSSWNVLFFSYQRPSGYITITIGKEEVKDLYAHKLKKRKNCFIW